MGNAHEHRELMAAAFQFGTTKTVEEVVAEQEARHELAEQERKRKASTPTNPFAKRAAPKAPKPGTPRASEMAKARAMIAAARAKLPTSPPAPE